MALPTIFEMNFVDMWQSLQIRRFFLIQRGVPGGVLMSPNAIASFSLWWHKGNTFLLPHHPEQILYKACNLHRASALTISAVLHGFQLSEGGLDHLLQHMDLTIHFHPCARDYILLRMLRSTFLPDTWLVWKNPTRWVRRHEMTSNTKATSNTDDAPYNRVWVNAP
jgi:hypothetical protein